jgi:hypothetical protein
MSSKARATTATRKTTNNKAIMSQKTNKKLAKLLIYIGRQEIKIEL